MSITRNTKLNSALEAALNALDPLVNAYALHSDLPGEMKVLIQPITIKKLKAAKAAQDGLNKFYRCRG